MEAALAGRNPESVPRPTAALIPDNATLHPG